MPLCDTSEKPNQVLEVAYVPLTVGCSEDSDEQISFR